MNSGKKSDHLKNLKILQEAYSPHRTVHTHASFIRCDIDGFESIQRLKHFVEAINLGMLPDGEVMIYMAGKIKEYLDGNKKNLNEAFSLHSLRGVGNAAELYRRKLEIADKANAMFLFQVCDKINKDDAAIKTLEMYKEDSENYTALMKKEQRHKKNKTFKNQISSGNKLSKKAKKDT